MNKMLPALAAVLLAGAAAPAMAADSSVLVVDFNRVFSDSAAAKSGTSQLQAKYNALLQQRRAAFQSASQAFASQRDAAASAQRALKPGQSLPAATQQSLQQAYERGQQAQQQLQDTQEDVNDAISYVRQQVVEHTQPIAEQVRAERRAAVVIDKGQALATDPAVDVTSVVIQRLDAAFAQPSITPPQQQAPAAPSTATPSNSRSPQGR